MKTVKERIIETLRETGRTNVETVINFMEQNGYFVVRCGSHHQYMGGLAEHAWQTYQLAQKMEEKRRKEDKGYRGLNKESLAICCLLHDFCNCSGKHHIHGHGYRSARMVKELGMKLKRDEYLAIRYHMSLGRHKGEHDYNDACHCHLRHVVHMADGHSAGMKRGCEV